MLRVKTIVKQSTIPNAGNGLFAAEPIKMGKIIWELDFFRDQIYSRFQLNDLSIQDREYVIKYSYREGNYFILCSDDGKYINHSDTPNIIDLKHNGFSISIAARDIQEGEELLCDYTTFDDDSKNGVSF